MKLGALIHSQLDAIVERWEAATREALGPAKVATLGETLRDPYLNLILQTLADTPAAFSRERSSRALHGEGHNAPEQDSAARYVALRYAAGLTVADMVCELGLLWPTVLSVSRATGNLDQEASLDELERFTGALHRMLARSVQGYLDKVSAAGDMFLAILGHEIRNPLQAIAVAGKLLAVPSLPDPIRVETAARVSRATKLMEGLVSDLIDFTRSRLGVRARVERASCDLHQACQEALELAQMSAPEREFRPEFVGTLLLEADRARLRQVISNLLNNAVQHGDATTPISLSAIGTEESIVLTVSNFGRTIPEDAARLIFEPLVQVPISSADPSKRFKHSLGLGLYIAREIVSGHDGTISVHSSPTAGTTFTVRLPRQPNGGIPEAT
jgi:signal transduction histidine kinase